MRRLLSSAIWLLVACLTIVSCADPTPPASVTLRFFNPVTTPPVAGLVNLMRTIHQEFGIEVTVGGLNGTPEVISALQTGKADLGLASADSVYQAFRRGLTPESGPTQNLRGVAVGGASRLGILVRRNSNIRAIPDLRGRRVALPPVTTTGEVLTQRVLELSGLMPGDVDARVHQPREMANFLESEQLEALVIVTISNIETLLPTGRSHEFRILPLPQGVISQVRAELPFVRLTSITWNNGDSVEEIPTMGVDFVVLANKNVPDDVIYHLTGGILAAAPTNNPFEIDIDQAPATPIPLHPGAARYYREVQLLK